MDSTSTCFMYGNRVDIGSNRSPLDDFSPIMIGQDEVMPYRQQINVGVYGVFFAEPKTQRPKRSSKFPTSKNKEGSLFYIILC